MQTIRFGSELLHTTPEDRLNDLLDFRRAYPESIAGVSQVTRRSASAPAVPEFCDVPRNSTLATYEGLKEYDEPSAVKARLRSKGRDDLAAWVNRACIARQFVAHDGARRFGEVAQVLADSLAEDAAPSSCCNGALAGRQTTLDEYLTKKKYLYQVLPTGHTTLNIDLIL